MLAVAGSASGFAQQSKPTQLAPAEIPHIVRYEGELSKIPEDTSDQILGITFAIYSEEFDGAPLWREVQSVRISKDGKYTVELGKMTQGGMPADLFSTGEPRWLGVQVNGEAEQPRDPLVSVPYALTAGDAQTLGGLPASAFVQIAAPSATALTTGVTPSAVKSSATAAVTTNGGTAHMLALFDTATDIANSQIYDNGTNVGIGTTAPAAKLDVNGSAMFHSSVQLPPAGAATATAGVSSPALSLAASVFNSSTKKAQNETFSWRVDPVGNNTPTASAKMNLLLNNTNTGFSISDKGLMTFAA